MRYVIVGPMLNEQEHIEAAIDSCVSDDLIDVEWFSGVPESRMPARTVAELSKGSWRNVLEMQESQAFESLALVGASLGQAA